jgi:effector-binding domain-containing protein
MTSQANPQPRADSGGQATVFIPVPGRVQPVGRVTSLVIPAAELAIITHHGALADADLSYAQLGSYTATHEISIDGPLYEYYLRGGGDTPDESEWRTEIGWPIFRADASRARGADAVTVIKSRGAR